MAKSQFLKAGAVAAMSALLALSIMPSSAMAQDRGHGRHAPDGASTARSDSRPAWRGSREARPSPQQRVQPQQRARPEARADNGGSSAWRARGRDGETARSVREQHQASERRAEQHRVTPPQTRNPNTGEVRRSRPDNAWSRPDTPRPGVVRNNDRRDGNWNDRDGNRNGWKDGRRYEPSRVTNPRRDDDRRWSYSNGRYNWNRDWRNDRRYDWNSHRRNYRHVYSIGRYRAPYSSYYYRPITIGYRLNAPFYGNSYWIVDPWDYRLPQAYGPYRWVRYFDDVLLVNIHTGTVVDVIRNFFW